MKRGRGGKGVYENFTPNQKALSERFTRYSVTRGGEGRMRRSMRKERKGETGDDAAAASLNGK